LFQTRRKPIQSPKMAIYKIKKMIVVLISRIKNWTISPIFGQKNYP